MELTRKSPLGSGLSSRSGAIATAAVAAVAVAVLVFTALNKARSGASANEPAAALVASQLIAKGSAGEAIASAHTYRATKVRESALVAGAITDVSQLQGKVATEDIYPGQQISTADFAPAKSALAARLSQESRAISVPLDGAHGMIGDVHAGDHVDVLAGFNVQRDGDARTRPVMRVLARNVVVLKADKGGSAAMGSGTKNVILRLNQQTAAQVAFASDNGKVWIMLRPGAGAQDARPRLITLESLLFGIPSISAAGGQR